MNSKKKFICLEAIMAAIVIVLLFIMLKEQMGKQSYKISVILQDSDSSQWSALRYGLRMAAKDRGAEVFFASIGNELTVHEQINTIKYEIDNGADAVIVQPVSGADTEAELKNLRKKLLLCLLGLLHLKIGMLLYYQQQRRTIMLWEGFWQRKY